MECLMPKERDRSRWLRDGELAEYLGVTKMTLWRWRRKPGLNFPQPSMINGVPYTDGEELDAWMKARVVSRLTNDAA
jgi:predicted DNA-binding transcriptional regulator AlpA